MVVRGILTSDSDGGTNLAEQQNGGQLCLLFCNPNTSTAVVILKGNTWECCSVPLLKSCQSAQEWRSHCLKVQHFKIKISHLCA